MGETATVTAADGHALEVYIAAPRGQAKGAVVVIQEIFGVNAHIRRVTDGFAAAGYFALAPALFDRVGKNLTVAYNRIAEGRNAVGKLNLGEVEADLAAAATLGAQHGRVGVVGYCWGGAMAYFAAAKVERIACAVDYYGTHTVQLCEQMKPRVPVMYHFALRDKSIPLEAIARIKAADPLGIYHLYEDADHGFNCDERPQYNAEAASLALTYTREFLSARLGPAR